MILNELLEKRLTTIERRLKALINDHQKEILTLKEAAQMLRISDRKLHRMLHSTKPPPHFMIGVHYRFDKNELLEWFKKTKSND